MLERIQIDDERRRLVETTRECLDAAIRVMGPGVRVSAVSAAVQVLAESRGYSVVRDYAGHGIGTRLHEDPQVPNYVDDATPMHDTVLRPGMVICVEPMLNLGGAEVEVLDDGWTVVTRDRSLMGADRNGPWLHATLVVVVALVVALNLTLLALLLLG